MGPSNVFWLSTTPGNADIYSEHKHSSCTNINFNVPTKRNGTSLQLGKQISPASSDIKHDAQFTRTAHYSFNSDPHTLNFDLHCLMLQPKIKEHKAYGNLFVYFMILSHTRMQLRCQQARVSLDHQILTSPKQINFAPSKFNLRLLFQKTYAPGPHILTHRPQILRGVRIWAPFRVPSPERRVKMFWFYGFERR